jgi:hypothetical protein
MTTREDDMDWFVKSCIISGDHKPGMIAQNLFADFVHTQLSLVPSSGNAVEQARQLALARYRRKGACGLIN